jgi:recombination protein RecT
MALKNAPIKPQSAQDVLVIGFRKDLTNITPYIEALLPKHMVQRFLRMAQLAVMRDGKLLECTKKSLLLALLWCAQRGLEPGVEDGCWLIPFKGKVTPIPGYKGLIAKAIEVGAALSVDAFAVYEHDEFFYCFGLEPDLRHVPPKLGDDRGKMVGAYSLITLPNGEKKFRVMDMKDIERIRGLSAGWKNAPDSGVWHDHPEAMALKTVIKQGLKTVPMREDLRDLLSDDGMIEAGGAVGALLAGAGQEVPDDLKEGPEDLEEAQGKGAGPDTTLFDGLVESELGGLPEDEKATRRAHLAENLRLSAKNTKKTVPAFKEYAAGYFHPYENTKGEAKDGYWQTFLAWEATNYPPQPEPGFGPAGLTLKVADPEHVFAERKQALVSAILQKAIPLPDLELVNWGDVTPENIDSLEEVVKNWTVKVKKT